MNKVTVEAVGLNVDDTSGLKSGDFVLGLGRQVRKVLIGLKPTLTPLFRKTFDILSVTPFTYGKTTNDVCTSSKVLLFVTCLVLRWESQVLMNNNYALRFHQDLVTPFTYGKTTNDVCTSSKVLLFVTCLVLRWESQVLMNNNYPLRFIKTCDSQRKTRHVTNSNTLDEVQTSFVVFPYVKGVTEKISKVLRNNGVKVGFKPINTWCSCFLRPKDKVTTFQSRCIV